MHQHIVNPAKEQAGGYKVTPETKGFENCTQLKNS